MYWDPAFKKNSSIYIRNYEIWSATFYRSCAFACSCTASVCGNPPSWHHGQTDIFWSILPCPGKCFGALGNSSGTPWSICYLLFLRMFFLDLSVYTLPSILLPPNPWALFIVELLAKTKFSSQKSFPGTLPCRILLDVSKGCHNTRMLPYTWRVTSLHPSIVRWYYSRLICIGNA